MAAHTYDAKRSPTMRRNAIAMRAFIEDCKLLGLKVTVGLSGTGIADNTPHDLVVHVRAGNGAHGPVNLAGRVDRDIRDTILRLRRQIGPVALGGF